MLACLRLNLFLLCRDSNYFGVGSGLPLLEMQHELVVNLGLSPPEGLGPFKCAVTH